MKKLILTATAISTGLCFGQTFSDDFESYNVGDYIGVNSSTWTTWSGSTGGTEDAQVTDNNANSGSNATYFSSTSANGGPQDVVLPFSAEYNTGTFSYSKSLFVETGKGAYFNLQESSTIGTVWAMDVTFNSDGTFNITSQGAAVFSGTYTQNTWFDLDLDADLNTNTWTISIDGSSLGNFQLTGYQVASVDIFPLNGNGFYMDDVSYNYAPFSMPNLNAAASKIQMGVLAGQTVMPKAEIRNLGNTAITSFDLEVSYNGNSVTENISGVNIASGDAYAVDFTNSLTLVAGANNVILTVSNVNGMTADDNAADDIKTLSINPVVPAAGKMVIGEEATGTWCGWCPRGDIALQYMDANYKGFFQGIAVHNGDPMTNSTYDAGIGTMIGGYPSGLVDRGSDVDPSTFEAGFLERIVIDPTGMVLNGATWDAGTRELNVSVTMTFPNGANGNYKVACVLAEDSVTGTASGYNQSNYYAGGGNGDMGGYESLPNPVPAAQMVYLHVARDISPSFGGLSNAYPSSITAGQSFTHNFTFTLDQDWDENMIHIVGMLIDPNNRIDNASSTTIDEAVNNGFVAGDTVTSVTELSQMDAEYSLYPNPSSDNTQVQLLLKQNENVTMTITDINGKVIAIRNYGELSGAQYLPISASEWESGVYFIQLQVGSKLATMKFLKN